MAAHSRCVQLGINSGWRPAPAGHPVQRAMQQGCVPCAYLYADTVEEFGTWDQRLPAEVQRIGVIAFWYECDPAVLQWALVRSRSPDAMMMRVLDASAGKVHPKSRALFSIAVAGLSRHPELGDDFAARFAAPLPPGQMRPAVPIHRAYGRLISAHAYHSESKFAHVLRLVGPRLGYHSEMMLKAAQHGWVSTMKMVRGRHPRCFHDMMSLAVSNAARGSHLAALELIREWELEGLLDREIVYDYALSEAILSDERTRRALIEWGATYQGALLTRIRFLGSNRFVEARNARFRAECRAYLATGQVDLAAAACLAREVGNENAEFIERLAREA